MELHWDVWASSDFWGRLTLVALVLATLFQTLFIIEFARRPWYRVRPGRAMMLKSASLLAILWITVGNEFLIYDYQHHVTAIGMCLVALGIYYQFVVLITSPHDMHFEEEPE